MTGNYSPNYIVGISYMAKGAINHRAVRGSIQSSLKAGAPSIREKCVTISEEVRKQMLFFPKLEHFLIILLDADRTFLGM